jgi:RNA polymerase sigma-70 factor, ECF subfamily
MSLAEVRSAAKADDVDQLFRAAYPKLAGWVRRLVGDDDTAHEIASEVFVRLLSRWITVENPQSYLYMIAANLVKDHWRRTERERRAMRSVWAGAGQEAVTHPCQDVDVRNLIGSLPARLRDPFLLHYYAGFAICDVATLLRRPWSVTWRQLLPGRLRNFSAGQTRWSSRPAPAQGAVLHARTPLTGPPPC